jgi:hypothetical protein
MVAILRKLRDLANIDTPNLNLDGALGIFWKNSPLKRKTPRKRPLFDTAMIGRVEESEKTREPFPNGKDRFPREIELFRFSVFAKPRKSPSAASSFDFGVAMVAILRKLRDLANIDTPNLNLDGALAKCFGTLPEPARKRLSAQ